MLVTKRALSERENSCSFDLLKPLRALLVMMSLELWSFSPRLLTWSTLMQGALWDLPFLERTQSTAVVALLLNISLAHFTWLHPIITVSH